MHSKFIELYNFLSPTAGEFGVEVEAELLDRNDERVPMQWRQELDHSLRGEAFEYVLKNPTSLDEASEDVIELYNTKLTDVSDSVRAGVHVHINVQQKTPLEILNIITLATILEGPMSHMCGEGRKGNLFCLRTLDAEQYCIELGAFVESGDWTYISNDKVRYSFLNPTSLFKYGSLEFRGLRTPTNPQPILEWLQVIHNLVDKAASYNNPTDIISDMSGEGVLEFVSSTLGREVNYPEMDREVYESMRNLQIFLMKDPKAWYDWAEKFEKTKPEVEEDSFDD